MSVPVSIQGKKQRNNFNHDNNNKVNRSECNDA